MRDPGPDIEPEFYHSLSSCWPLGQCAACTASYVPRDMSRNAVTSERQFLRDGAPLPLHEDLPLLVLQRLLEPVDLEREGVSEKKCWIFTKIIK